MNIIRTDLSIAARSGALDPNLAFSQVFEAHRSLVNQTASSSLRGMLDVISDTGLYAKGIKALQKAAEDQERAQLEAEKNPLKAAEPNAASSINHSTNTGRFEGAVSASRFLDGWPGTMEHIRNSLPDPSPERNLANNVHFFTFWTRDDGFQVANGNMSKLDTIRSNFNSLHNLRTDIQNLLNSIPNTPANATRRANIQNLLNNTNHVIANAGPLRNFVDSNIIRIQGVPPSNMTDLGNGYLLATFGNTGISALVEPGGRQLLIGADGTVDDLRNTLHNQWRFNTTTTFVLPGDTKVTINPGNPANLLVSRGIHAMTIENLGPNRVPQPSDYTSLNGRIMDRDSNDGYLVYYSWGGNWAIDGNKLGDFNNRINTATTPRFSELRLDPTDITLSPEVSELRNELGITVLDYDGDGRFNDEEIAQIQVIFTQHVRNLEVAYNEALSRISAANTALMELTEMLDQMRKEAEKQTDGNQVESAENRALMRSIEQRLNAALALLRGDGTGTTPTIDGGIESNASLVLDQLNQISQQDSSFVLPPTRPSNSVPDTSSSSSTPSTPTPPDPLGDSMRRASRLLSGLTANLRLLDLPPTVTEPSNVTTPTPETEPALGSPSQGDLRTTIEQLASVLASLLGRGETGLSPTDAGLSAPQPVPVSVPSTGTGTPLKEGSPDPQTQPPEQSQTSGSIDPSLPPPVVGNQGPPPPVGDTVPLGEETPITDSSTVTETGPSVIDESIELDNEEVSLADQVQDIALGLQELLEALTESGVIDLSALPLNQGSSAFIQALLQSLTLDTPTSELSPPPTVTGTPEQNPPVTAPSIQGQSGAGVSFGFPTTPPPPTGDPSTSSTGPSGVSPTSPTYNAINLPALLSFLGILAQFGSATRAVAPQTGNTTPGQTELAGVGSLQPLSRSEENINNALATGNAQTGQTRTNEQVALLLSGLAALGSAGAGQSSGNQGSAAPTNEELRLGLRAFLTALSALGVFAVNQTQDSGNPVQVTGGGTPTIGGPTSTENEEGKTTAITSNFYTDPELLKQLRANLERAEQTYRDQLERATVLFGESQQTVQKFVSLIQQDEVVQELIQSDELSDEQQNLFADKMRDLRQDLGIEWGGNDQTPASQSDLVSRAVRSGMMV
jgi:hypothetical protein